MIETAVEKATELKDRELILESEIRLGRIAVYSGIGDVSRIETFIDTAREIGSAELEIKAHILKIYALLITSEVAIVQKALDYVNELEELKNYPELQLELSVLRVIMEFSSGKHDSSLRLLKDALRECLSRDLALIVSDLSALGDACGLSEKIPAKTDEKMSQCISRLTLELSEPEIERQKTLQKRITEFYKKVIEAPGKPVGAGRIPEKKRAF